MSRILKRVFALVVMIWIVISFSACSDDENNISTPETLNGTIHIVGVPFEAQASWALTGPDGFDEAGTGEATFGNVVPGTYSATWEDSEGWITPPDEECPLAAGTTVTFIGSYDAVPPPPTFEILVQPLPFGVYAPWSLAGPDDLIVSGSGETVLEDMPTGLYTMTWEEYISGDFEWTTPEPQTTTLDDDYAFVATYVEIVPPPVFLDIPAGNFLMGSPDDELGRDDDEGPAWDVTMTNGFAIGETEVTNRQFGIMLQWAFDEGYVTVEGDSVLDAIDGSTDLLVDLNYQYGTSIRFNDGVFTAFNLNRPVTSMTWQGAAAYCDWLNLEAGLPLAYDHATWQCNGGDPYGATGYRLPTEAEWEYACRAGSTTAFFYGDIVNEVTDPNLRFVAWYRSTTDDPRPVGGLEPNAWGLFDMHGNAWEFCNDWYGAYTAEPNDPVGPVIGETRVIRGGSYYSLARGCRSANRNPYLTNLFIGFRPTITR